METIKVRNVHDALLRGIDLFRGGDVHAQDSRAGATLEVETPVATTYLKPNERVLFWEERDANPFFHLFEGLWMLAGRQDVEYLSWFNSRMAEFSDDGMTFNGAYGYRWLFNFEKNQLDIIARRLAKDPHDRRCVLAIWDCTKDLDRQTLDTPCNTHIYFKVRGGKLNMTVCCRSNDMIWGAYGANAVHFSMLQEYMAAKIGVPLGTYTQISDSFHVYKDIYEKLEKRMPALDYYEWKYTKHNPYEDIKPYPMVQNIEEWDMDLIKFMELGEYGQGETTFNNDYFKHVAVPMLVAWNHHKLNKDTDLAIAILKDECFAEDWSEAGVDWLLRRKQQKEELKDTEAIIGKT